MIKPGYLCFALFALIASCLHAQQAPVASPGTVSLAEIRIRDPFILPDSAQRIYYLFGTNYPDAAPGKGGFVSSKSVMPAKTPLRHDGYNSE